MTSLTGQSPILPKLITIITVSLVVGGVVLYILFQARFLIQGPQVLLTTKLDTIQTEREITLEGTAKNITAIYLNGRSIVTNEAGYFRESVVLQNGYSIIRIDAEDRYGRTTFVEQSIVYQPYQE